jgi:hypothetical protein
VERSAQGERNGEIIEERQPGHDGQQNAETGEQQEMSRIEKVTHRSQVSAQFERIATSPLDPNSAAQNVPPKPPVSHQTEPRIFERCGLVVLEEEVADPGERVTLDEPNRNEPPPLRDHGSDEQRERNARAGEVQSPAGPVGVLAEIKGIEIAECPKRVLVHLDSPKGKDTTCPNIT